MADNVNTPPKFVGLNSSIMKVKMTIFLQSLESRVAKVITKPFVIPSDDKDTWSDITIKVFGANVRAHYALLQALNDNDFSRVINCKPIFEI